MKYGHRVLVGALVVVALAAKRANNGSSWESALVDLQSALEATFYPTCGWL